MKPALHIPLSDASLRMLGEICAIQGQIERLMQESLWMLLDMWIDDAAAILGSTNLRNNVDIWARIVSSKCEDRRTLAHVTAVVDGIATLTTGRNDFIHAIFAKETSIHENDLMLLTLMKLWRNEDG
jgi:hypothetical protein